jgi:hypothetical protein
MAAILVALVAGCGNRDDIFGTTGAGAPPAGDPRRKGGSTK